jgi:heterodisulfide reductase subunit A
MARIGVFICHCGHNIAGYLDVAALVASARSLPFVVLALESATSLGSVDPHQVARPGAAACQGMFIFVEGRAS